MAQVKFFRGDRINYDSKDKHLNAIYFATDTQELLMGDKAYGMSADNVAILSNAFVSAEFVTPTTIKLSRQGGNNSVDIELPEASESQAGFMSAANFSKLKNIEKGAQVNVIEKITLNGSDPLIVTDKTIDIPLATGVLAGLVKSAEGENKVAVSADGTMEVNSLNVNKLVQTEGDYIILNGGNSAAEY
jgi:hypothetical protein